MDVNNCPTCGCSCRYDKNNAAKDSNLHQYPMKTHNLCLEGSAPLQCSSVSLSNTLTTSTQRTDAANGRTNELGEACLATDVIQGGKLDVMYKQLKMETLPDGFVCNKMSDKILLYKLDISGGLIAIECGIIVTSDFQVICSSYNEILPVNIYEDLLSQEKHITSISQLLNIMSLLNNCRQAGDGSTCVLELKQDMLSRSSEELLIENSSENIHSLPVVCGSVSRVKPEIKECTDMTYNPCGETSNTRSTDIDSNQRLNEDYSIIETIRQENLSDQNDDSLDVSPSETYDDEEFSELLERCYHKTNSDVTDQPCDGYKDVMKGERKQTTDSRIRDSSVVLRRVDITHSLRAASHVQEKPFDCSSCCKKFSTSDERDVHCGSVHIVEDPYSCQHCNYKSSQKRNLSLHQTEVHGRIKRFLCEKCHYMSARKRDLMQHCAAVHNNEKLYKCSQCETAFSQKQNLLTHVKTVHRKQKPYSCFICSRSFSRKADVASHVDAVHNCLQPYQCQQCSKRFSRKFHRNVHVKTVHRLTALTQLSVVLSR